MSVKAVTAPGKSDVLVFPLYKDKKGLSAAVADVLSKEELTQAWEAGFEGQAGDTLVFWSRKGRRFLLVGLGPRAEIGLTALRGAASAVVKRLREGTWPRIVFLLPENIGTPSDAAQAVAEGWILGSYQFLSYQTKRAHPTPPSLALARHRSPLKELENGAARGVILAEAVCAARDLINRPASDKTPTQLGREWSRWSTGSLRVRVWPLSRIRRQRMGALLGVNRGSSHPPVFVEAHYRPKNPVKCVALVGKGVTFDSGGLSLKPAEGMMTMKYDMAGAATVMAAVRAIHQLGLPLEVYALAPLTENMPGPNALKPGDVVRAANGKTIEVLNTDAEGRLILADALSWAAQLPVKEIVDLATLTGAATVALGKSYGALMSNNVDLSLRLEKAAGLAGEKLWALPLEAGYREHMKSTVADLKNIGNPGEAGTIIGGLFLKEFVGEKPWAHVDMASVGWASTPHKLGPQGATGALVRTLIHWAILTCRGS